MTGFWRGWNSRLSTWFRDYLYIPLGGNRLGSMRTYSNLLAGFFLCGLWHGAKWTFVVWGLYHGLFLIIARAGLCVALQRIGRGYPHLYPLLLVSARCVLVRA